MFPASLDVPSCIEQRTIELGQTPRRADCAVLRRNDGQEALRGHERWGRSATFLPMAPASSLRSPTARRGSRTQQRGWRSRGSLWTQRYSVWRFPSHDGDAHLEVNPDGSGVRVFASGNRNPIGLAPAPDAAVLWTVVSVQDGAFYGSPYSYSGKNLEKPVKPHRLDLVEKPIAPHCAIGAPKPRSTSRSTNPPEPKNRRRHRRVGRVVPCHSPDKSRTGSTDK
jgi:hypothetical protein